MSNLAFLVGCEEYDQENIDNLLGVNDDVISMQNALINYCGCSHEHVYTVTSQPDSACEPTGTKIIDLIIQKANKYGDESIDNLFFYYSGHGYLSAQNRVCLIFRDSMTFPVIVGTVEVETIISALKQFVNVNHIVLFLDICQNEIMTKGVIGDQIIPSDYFPQGVVIFFSCFPQNASYMIPQGAYNEYGQGSVFTKCLVDSLNPQNKCHNVKEISAYLKKEVTHLSRQLGFEQKPYTQTEDISLNEVVITDYIRRIDFNMSDEEKSMVKNFASQISELNDISRINGIGRGEGKKMEDLCTQISHMICGAAQKESGIFNPKTDLDKLILDINVYLKLLNTFRKKIKFIIRIHLNRDKFTNLLLLDTSTSSFIKKLEEHTLGMQKDLAVLDKMEELLLISKKTMSLYIFSIEVALNNYNVSNPELLKRQADELEKYFPTYNVFCQKIVRYRTFLSELWMQIDKTILLCVPLTSELQLLLTSNRNADEITKPIYMLVKNIEQIDRSIKEKKYI